MGGAGADRSRVAIDRPQHTHTQQSNSAREAIGWRMTGGSGHDVGTGHSQPSKAAAEKTNVVAAAVVTATALGTNNNQIKAAARETAVVMAVVMAMAACDGDGDGVDNGDNDSGIDDGDKDNGGVILVDGLVKNT